MERQTWTGFDYCDFPEPAKTHLKELFQKVGQNNDSWFPWEIMDEDGEDGVAASYIGLEATQVIDQAMIEAGGKPGEFVYIAYSW